MDNDLPGILRAYNGQIVWLYQPYYYTFGGMLYRFGKHLSYTENTGTGQGFVFGCFYPISATLTVQ
jgi:hypothetical protein